MISRREMIKRTAQCGVLIALPTPFVRALEPAAEGEIVNDVQSQLNRTRVESILEPRSLDEVQSLVRRARRDGKVVTVSGSRHCMGGQQFGSEAVLFDMRQLDRVLDFDRDEGLIEVEAGIQWPALMEFLRKERDGDERGWTIRQKQTGVDRVTIGGSMAANIHGRGLRFPPLVSDVESFVLVDPSGKVRNCSRKENSELFSLAIGGYGLFGIIAQATLRLTPIAKLERVVEMITVKDLMPKVQQRKADGFLYGDCQYSIDLTNDPDSYPGVFSCYRQVPLETPIPSNQKMLSGADWAELYAMTRRDKKAAFTRYADYYKTTSGQVYWSDEQQMAGVFDAYRKAVDVSRGTEMISEVFVPAGAFNAFMTKARQDAIDHKVDLTYGTIRFIEKEDETFLAWAREPWVCIVCNFHVMHTQQGIRKAAEDFRRLFDRAIEFGGSYFLPYHRWATRRQVEACHPRFVEFLKLKNKYDPSGFLQSNWWRHYRQMFS